MMPLIFGEVGKPDIIKKVSGSHEIKKHLENLGFVSGAEVYIIASIGGNIIVNIKEARVAISKEMAQKIFI